MPGSGRRRDGDSRRGDGASVSWGRAGMARLDEKIEMFTVAIESGAGILREPCFMFMLES